MRRIGARKRLAAQQIAAVSIAQRQRLATPAVAGQKPAFEIDAPYIVGAAALGKQRTRGRTAAAKLAPHRQPFTVEQCADRARCWPSDRWRPPCKIGPYFAGPQVECSRRT